MYYYILKILRKLYAFVFAVPPLQKPECEKNPEVVNELIYQLLISNKPIMISRFGANELFCMVSFLGITKNNRNILSYIKGNSEAWWWNNKNLNNMNLVAGFFPPTPENFKKFCQMMIKDIEQVDILGSWLPNEKYFKEELSNCKMVRLELLNPFFSDFIWTKALEGKKVLVVHPFAATIEKQYKKRNLLFKKDILPEFNLITLKAIQSSAGENTPFTDWFSALDFMKSEIDSIDYDFCLIGAGAYGFPLAAHIKRKGKKAIHLGGSLQLLFGIKGKRWENPDYNPIYNYSELMNEYWVKPSLEEMPRGAKKVEGATYW